MITFRKGRSLALALCLLAGACFGSNAQAAALTGQTAVQTAEAMGLGWNLGNSLDAYGNGKAEETVWGNPAITPELLHAARQAGFKTVRIPVTYIGRVGASPDYKIDSDWLDRVQQVVDWARQEDFYVVINIHHDGGNDWAGGGWLNCEAKDQKAVQAKFRAIWQQLAARFRDYDQHLVFEAMNEIHETGNWSEPKKAASMQNVNRYNQIFVDTVRAAGGENADRVLIASGYNTNIRYTTQPAYGWQLPKDQAKARLMVSLHYYDPYDFTINSDEKTGVWGWGREALKRGDKVLSWHAEESVDQAMQTLHDKFVTQGVPFFLGEYGAIDKSKLHPRNAEYRAHWYRYVTKAIKQAGGVPVVWDNGAPHEDTFTFINRKTNTVGDQKLLQAVKDGYADAVAQQKNNK